MPIIDLNNPSQAFCFAIFMLVVIAWSMWAGAGDSGGDTGRFFQHAPPVLLFAMFVVTAAIELYQIVTIGFAVHER